MLDSENQTKVHFKMYKDGKQWVIRGLALLAVSLMVGGSVLGTLADVVSVEASEIHVDKSNKCIYQILKDNVSEITSKEEYRTLAKYSIVKNAIADANNVISNNLYLSFYVTNQQLLNVIVAAQNSYDVIKQYTGYAQDAALRQALAKVTDDLNGTNLYALIADNKTAVRLGLQADLKLAQNVVNSGGFTQNLDQIKKAVKEGNEALVATQQMVSGNYDVVNNAELKLREALAVLHQEVQNQLKQEISVATNNQDSSTNDLTQVIENANNVVTDQSSDVLDMLGAYAMLQTELTKVQQQSAHNADTTSDLGGTRAENEATVESSMAASAAANSAAQSMINSGREADAAMEAELGATAQAGQHVAESTATDASVNEAKAVSDSTAASAAANSAAQSMINSGREADAAMEQSLANSALASSVVADEAKQGQHYATSVASETTTNNHSVADFNNQKSAAVAEANNEANAQHVANDQNVVNAINNIKNATDVASLTDEADKAAIAIANAASRNVAASRMGSTNLVSNTAVSVVNAGVVNAGNQASANAVAGTPTPVANTTAGAVAPIANATVATASVNNGAATQTANADNGRHPKKAAIHGRKAVAEGSKSLHDTQMTNKHTGLITSLISALVAAVLALFFLFLWKRRKQQEEENVAANADEALLKDVQNAKDSW
ncbi:KxYKxGKxW signal peptide domain-containing protein [Weissella confusa]|uniref:KxYKxGKxW signal peptide domain-containing protein n=1 Tax=Weissella confusa TaxID=1583 RepID=UPI002F262883